mmetsp:Transcript_34824/g.56002  ORF Transcript_34824/g.56002 Transcript_34824/m.56002 type:complete len:529 (-) Transcript_34824:274-1860(-)
MMAGGRRSEYRDPRMSTQPVLHWETGCEYHVGFVFSLAFLAGLGSFLRGYEVGLMGGLLKAVGREFDLDTFQIQFIVSVQLLAAIVGALTGGEFADFVGRKWSILVYLLLFTMGSVLMMISEGFWMLVLARCTTGLGAGMSINVSGLYLAEIAPRRIRGTITTMNAVCVHTGPFIGYLVSYALHRRDVDTNDNWRFGYLSEAVLASSLWLLSYIFLPRSPYWLLTRGLNAEAEKIVNQRVKESDFLKRIGIINRIMATMKADMNQEPATWKETICDSANIYPLLLGCGLASVSQLVGVEAMLIYSSFTLSKMGVGETDSVLVGTMLAFSILLAAVITTFIVDIPSIGRRTPLLIGAAGVALASIILGVCAGGGISSGYSATAFVVWGLCYGFGYASVVYAVTPEIFAGGYRSKSVAIAGAVTRLSAFCVSMSYLYVAQSSIGLAGTFYTFGAVATLGFAFCMVSVPDLTHTNIGDYAKNPNAYSPAQRFSRSRRAGGKENEDGDFKLYEFEGNDEDEDETHGLLLSRG